MDKEKKIYPRTLTCDGVDVSFDFLIKTFDDEIIMAGYFDRAKAKVKSIGNGIGHRQVRVGWNRYSAKGAEYHTVYKPVSMGRDRFVYGFSIHEEVGTRFMVSTKEHLTDDFFQFLMRSCKLPLLDEWKDYLFKEFCSQSLIYQATGRSVEAVDPSRTIPIHGQPIHLMDVIIYDVGGVSNDSLKTVVSEGLKSRQIFIPGAEHSKPLVFSSFDEYITGYGASMVENLEKDIEVLSPLKGDVDGLAFKKKRLYPQQAACVNGINALVRSGSKYGLMIEGMGCGKTVQAAGVVEAYFNQKWLENHPGKTMRDMYLSKEVAYRNIMMAPSHLVEKWKEEILTEIPDARVTILDDFNKLIGLREAGKARNGKEWYLVSKDTCKLGSLYSPIPTDVGRKYPKVRYCQDCFETKKKFVPMRGMGNKCVCMECNSKKSFKQDLRAYGRMYGMLCPDCGELLINPSVKFLNQSEEEPSKCVLPPAAFASRTTANSVCYHCGAQLWGVDAKPIDMGGEWSKHVQNHKPAWYKISHDKNHAGKGKKTAFVLRGYEDEYLASSLIKTYEPVKREYGPRKTAPAAFIKKYLKGYFDFCVLDEAHKYENGGTAQSNAAHALMRVSDFTLCLTGTICNGKADSFFYLLYMLDSGRMRKMGYKYTDVTMFVQKYGTVETVYEVTDNGLGVYNSSSRGRQLQSPRVKPGISPLLFADFLLDKAVFLDLSDMSSHLPPLIEKVELVGLPDKVLRSYKCTTDTLKEALKSNEGKSMLSAILQFGLSYVDKPYGRNPIKSAYLKDAIVADIDNFPEYESPDNLLPKEEKLVELVNKEIQEGRNCFIYCSYTGEAETNITQRLKDIVETRCNLKGRVQILNSNSPEPTKRERWIKKKASEGMKVFICNPKCVETGLDFCFWFGGKYYNYPTLIFYQMSYELAVLWQASRRHYRLIQTEECRTYYIACEDTLQTAAVEIMAEKQVAASAIQGKFSAEGLTAMAKGVDPRVKLAQKLSRSDKTERSTLAGMFDALNASNNSTDEENKYKGFKEALTYYEIIGINPSEDVADGEELSIFSEFTFGEGQQAAVTSTVTVQEVEPLIVEKDEEETDPFELDSFFDLFSGLSTEATVVNPQLLEMEETDKKPKKAKKDKKLAEGQLSFFDLMSA